MTSERRSLNPVAELWRTLRHDDRAGQVVAGGAQEKTESREDPGVRRDQDGRHVEAPRQTARVEAAGAAERQQRSLPGIGALFDRNLADRLLHQGVDHLQDSGRNGLRGQDLSSLPMVSRAASAAERSRMIPPARPASDPRRPATRLASVTVGLEPPRP